ncbi:MAG: OmpA family protein [Deltaproteobacteria bacterium]|nr:OmpA family protein [Deltaproteobacteria bacterium]
MAKPKVIIVPWEDKQKWLCTFNDLMTLLLTFFVLILSMSSLSAQSVKEVQQTMLNALGVLEAGSIKEETIIEKLFSIDEIGKRQKIFKNLEPSEEVELDSPEMVEDEDTPADISDFTIVNQEGLQQREAIDQAEEAAFNQFRDLIKKDYYEPGIVMMKKERGIVLRMTGSILFTPGEVVPRKEAYPVLKKIAAIIKETKLTAFVEGHTDSRPIRSKRYPSNWELSVARASNMVKVLIEQFDAPPEKLAAAGYGDTVPVVPNTSPGNRTLNRRIEIVLAQF